MIKHEYIICSAIWFDDGIHHNDKSLPKGETGYVVCGRRHHNCFHTASILDPQRKYIKEQHEKEQGFMTNKNRFVSRLEAVDIAFNAGQTETRTEHPVGLFSEDLY